MPEQSERDPSPSTADLGYLGVSEARELIESGQISSAELTETLMRRIEAIDRDGPALHSVIAIDESAVEIARLRDDERREGRSRGPLHGIPVLVKDNLDTAGALPTTGGSLALTAPAGQPVRDASAVLRLRRAGAIVIGKANLSEWANFRSEHSSSGWSAVGGQCRNPHVLDRSPGGSSSGSGAAVSAGLAPLAVGTETDGSILCPATLCGVVGIKPTVGLVSRSGVIPISTSQDTVGPLARSVAGAAAMLEVLSRAAAPETGIFVPQPTRYPSGAAAAGSELPQGLRGMRIGVMRKVCFGYSSWADSAVEDVLKLVEAAGAEIVDPADIETIEEMGASEDEMTVLLHEFKAGLETYLAGRPGGPDDVPRTLAELVDFGDANAATELGFFGQDLFVRALTTGGLSSPAYLDALARNRRLAREQGIDATLARHRVDALVAPTMGPAWCIDHVNGDSHTGCCYGVSAVAGYPAISVPIGRASDLPLGICLMAGAFSEALLIRIAFEVEALVGLGPRPAWRATAPL